MERTTGWVSVVYHAEDISWNVPNFRALPLEVDHVVNSPPFCCGDATWCLRIYPNGKSDQESEGRLGLVLVRVEAHEQEHQVQYTLGILGSNGQVYEEFTDRHTFDGSNLEWGEFQFVNRSTAQLQAITPNGAVSTFCRMCVSRDAGVAPSLWMQPVLPNRSIARLQQDYLRLLRSGNHSDVVLNVRGLEFKAHKVILKARSSVFATLLANFTPEKGTAIVTIDDCDSDTFPDFLQYVYTARIEALNVGNVFSLYSTADTFDMQDLKELCLKYMTRSLSVDTFCDVMNLALQYEERELKEAATEFFTGNVQQIIVTARWLDFLSKNAIPANELFIVALPRFLLTR